MTTLVDAREYKLMLNHRWFQEPKAAAEALWDEVTQLAESLGFRTKGKLELNRESARTIKFFDTPDFSLHRAGFVLRQRVDGDEAEVTLKAMSPDFCIAEAAEIVASLDYESTSKFEEDIGAPWRSRFSRSTTIAIPKADLLSETDAVLSDALKFFPSLSSATRDRVPLSKELRLQPVNGLHAYETTYEDAKLVFVDGENEQKSSVALILWASQKKGRPLVAEFSFRLKKSDAGFPSVFCRQAKELFEALQIMDWHLPGGLTKTQYAYRSRNAQES